MELSYQDAINDLEHFRAQGADTGSLERIEGLINHCFIMMNKYSALERHAEQLNAQILQYKELIFGQSKKPPENDSSHDRELTTTNDEIQASSQEKCPEQSKQDSSPPLDNKTEKADAKQSHSNRGGRLSFDDYPNAPTTFCKHHDHKAGDLCPDCLTGKLYLVDPNKKVLIEGQSPFIVSRYLIEVLRCALCGMIFKAQAPVDVSHKYTPSAKAVLAYLHYGAGLTYYGVERMLNTQKAPIPLSTQSELVESAAGPVFALTNHLAKIGRESDLIIQDDTTVRILELIKENKEQCPKRKGMYTTGFVFKEDHPFVLYISGRQHAGENFDDLMAGRESTVIPTRVADALNANSDHKAVADQGKCNAHPFRKFRTLMSLFPDESSRVLQIYNQVYEHEAHCKNEGYTPTQRLLYHQKYSEPLMDELFRWAQEALKHKKVEPNSVLGKLLQYLLNHEPELTLFLRKEDVPIDSNEVERLLKEMIRYRKRSLFFGTCYSADYGSRYMSLIATCHMHRVDAIDYLTQIQFYEAEVWANPGAWLPWNYHQNLLGQAA